MIFTQLAKIRREHAIEYAKKHRPTPKLRRNSLRRIAIAHRMGSLTALPSTHCELQGAAQSLAIWQQKPRTVETRGQQPFARTSPYARDMATHSSFSTEKVQRVAEWGRLWAVTSRKEYGQHWRSGQGVAMQDWLVDLDQFQP